VQRWQRLGWTQLGVAGAINTAKVEAESGSELPLVEDASGALEVLLEDVSWAGKVVPMLGLLPTLTLAKVSSGTSLSPLD